MKILPTNNTIKAFEECLLTYNEFMDTDLMQRAIITIRKEIAEIEINDISWEYVHSSMIKNKKLKHRAQLFQCWFIFLLFLDEKGLIKDKYAGLYVKYKWEIITYLSHNSIHRFDIILNNNTIPTSFFGAPYKIKPQYNNYVAFVIPNCNESTHDLFMSYLKSLDDTVLQSRLNMGAILMFMYLCEIGNCTFNSINDFNDATFKKHYDIITNKEKSLITGKAVSEDKVVANLISFYLWIQQSMNEQKRKENFKIYSTQVLKYPRIISALKEKYVPVNYSIYEKPPKEDKLIINSQDMTLHTTSLADKISVLDVSWIQNDMLRTWVKECFWYDETHIIQTRVKQYNCIFDFVKLIDAKSSKSSTPIVSTEDILKYKSTIISGKIQDSSAGRKFGLVKYFLNFLNDNQYINIDPMIFRLLVHHDNESLAYKETYTKDEVHQILDVYKRTYEKTDDSKFKLLYSLYYYIIAIQSVSEMRVSTILNLKTDCIKETLSSKGHIEYKVVVQSKTSSNNSDEYNITRYVKSLIDEVKNITDNIRDEAIGIEKNYLFIYKRHNNSTISIVRQDALSVYHKKICNEHNIRYLRLGAIRNYYQQQVSNYVAQNGDDPMLIERLSKHGINVHIQHYDAVDIKAFCEKYYNIEIGNIELKGKIEKENLEDEHKTVAHGCGHCDSDKCVLSGNLDCLMCDKFVTTLDCIPHFENEIKLIDELIVRQKIVHEKEFLIAKKKLNVAYLTKLYELEEKINGNKKI